MTTADAAWVIDIDHLSKHYGKLCAIDALCFKVAKGEIVGFLGPNGAGKTTAMKILTCAQPASSGQAHICGLNVFEAPMQVKRQIGYLPEIVPVYADLTVHEYLHFAATLKGLRRQQRRAELSRVIERVNLGSVVHRLIGNLSKGFQQRCGLAQALLGDPPVLILDEPTVGLDPRQIGEVRGLIRELAGEHTVLLSTHILQEVVATCARVIVLNRGKIVADDNLTNLVKKYQTPQHDASLEEIFLTLTEV